MSTSSPLFRFSNGEITSAKAASAFSWEAPVPVNRFWDSIDYCRPARNFLGIFSDPELDELPIDPDSPDTSLMKHQLLLRLLEQKLAVEEAV